ncbi:MAG: L,D-transpeptidase family protein [Rhodobiaceae bacterium]|nr:L,D-transpeptidase family protein [Rhodobiaceae bacterium]MCC0013154.1 L,D-transpeptidase family protein [Rhodobiaceae bacterium]
MTDSKRTGMPSCRARRAGAALGVCIAAFAGGQFGIGQAAASTGSLPPLIQMPVPEAPHGITRGQVAAKQRHATRLASIENATSAALAALPLLDATGVSSTLREHVVQAAEADTKDQDLAEAKHFYETRNFAPAWTDHARLTPAAKATVERLRKANFDGLDPDDYSVDELEPSALRLRSVDDLVDFEIKMTAAVARYIRHAAMGRINPRSVSKNITISPERPDITGGLTRIVASRSPAEVLESYHPTHPGFVALREALARTYQNEEPGKKLVRIPDGPLIKPGQRDKRIPLLRVRLGLDPASENEMLYDDALSQAVIKLQEKSGLPAEGFIGKLTLGVLNGKSSASRSDILVNMERWRWLPHDLGRHHVFVNIPEYLVRVFTDGKVIHTTRVVVGKPSNQTPVFSDEIEHIVVNPTWSVPRSIATKEYLPRLQEDPTYLAKRNIQVLGRGGAVIDPTTVDWESYSRSTMPYHFRQPSGRGNALGNVKFMFPNEHSVYLHDTQSRSLFSRTARAYSHGCVRVHQPFEFADALLENEADWNGTKIKRMIGNGGERHVILKAHVPVHLTYFTAIAGAGGSSVRKLSDVYGHDARMKQMMGL